MYAQLLLNGAIAGSGYALIGLSFQVGYLPSRFFNFAHAASYAWGAYVCFFALRRLDAPVLLSVCLGVGAGCACGAILEGCVFSVLRRRGTTELVLLLASIGLYTVLQVLISILFGDETQGLSSFQVSEGLRIIGNARATAIELLIIGLALVLPFALYVLLHRSSWGLFYRAVCSDAELAAIRGIDSQRVTLLAATVAGGLAALAGILIGFDVGITPTMGLGALMGGIVAMIVGGVGSWPGVLLGGIFVGVVQQLGVSFLGSQWQDAISFFILLLFLTVFSRGMFGWRRERLSA